MLGNNNDTENIPVKNIRVVYILVNTFGYSFSEVSLSTAHNMLKVFESFHFVTSERFLTGQTYTKWAHGNIDDHQVLVEQIILLFCENAVP